VGGAFAVFFDYWADRFHPSLPRSLRLWLKLLLSRMCCNSITAVLRVSYGYSSLNSSTFVCHKLQQSVHYDDHGAEYIVGLLNW